MTKDCRKCGEEKPETDFYSAGSRSFSSWCKECLRIKRKNPDVMAARRALRKTQRIRENKYRRAYNSTERGRLNGLFHQAKRRAAKENLPFDISLQDLHIPALCPLLGVPISLNTKSHRPNSPSLDKIDPKLGYVKGNVWIISYRANSIKNDASIEELERIALGLRARQSTR